MQRIPTLTWQIGQTRGESLLAYNRQIIPLGMVVRVQWRNGGFVWHRPWAIEVREGENIRRLPIHDLTTYTIAALFSAACLLFLAIRRKKQ